MGIAGWQGSLDRVPFPFPSGGGVWLDDDTILVPLFGLPGAPLATYRIGSPPTVIQPPRGANTMVAGAGRYLAFLADGGRTGVYGSLGSLPVAGLGAASLEGHLAYIPNYQAGIGVVVSSTGGVETFIPQANSLDLQILGPTAILWRNGTRPAVANYAEPVTVVPGLGWRRAVVDGVDWIVYWTDSLGLIAHRWMDPTHGFVIEPTPTAFNHDAVGLPGVLRVAYSRTQGEGPNDLVVVDIPPQGNAQYQLVNLLTLGPVHTPSAGPFSAPLHVGYFFKYSTQYGDNPSAPGNVSIVNDPGAAQRAVGRIIPSTDPAVLAVAATRWHDVVGIYVADETQSSPAPLEALAAAAILWMKAKGLPRRPLISYSAANRWPALRNIDWTGVQLYADPAEDPGTWDAALSVFGRQFNQWIDTIPPPRPIVLICQAYARNGTWTNPETLTALQALFNELARVHSHRVRLVALFSDGRPTGTREREYLRPWHQALVNAQPGLPPILDLTPPPDPPVDPPVDPPRAPGYPSIQQVTFMDKETVGLVGFGGKYLRIDQNEAGQGLFKGYLIHFDRDTVGRDEEFEVTKPDDHYQLRHVATNTILGADATKYSDNICKQFYTMPVNKRGGYESWTIGKLPSGVIIAMIEHEQDGHQYATASLAVVRQ